MPEQRRLTTEKQAVVGLLQWANMYLPPLGLDESILTNPEYIKIRQKKEKKYLTNPADCAII